MPLTLRGQQGKRRIAGGAAPDAPSRWPLAAALTLAVAAVGVAAWRIGAARATSSGPATPRTPVQLILALERTAIADGEPRRAYEELGAACLRMGHVLSARAAFRRAETMGPPSRWLVEQLAWCALRLDRREEALSAYRRLLTMDALESGGGERPTGYLRLAAAALRMGETDTARATLRALPLAVRQSLLAPRSARERLALIRYLSLVEETSSDAEIEAIAQRVIAAMPEEPAGFAAAARTALRGGRSKVALGVVDRALARAPGDAALHALRGDALLARGDARSRAAARGAYRRAVALQPSLGPASYRLATLALAAGDAREAARGFAAARAVGTEPIAALRGLARAAEVAGDRLAAARWRAEYHEKVGEIDAARRAYGRLLAVPSAKLAATERLADLDARHQRLRDAVVRLEAASKEAPRSVAIGQALARVYRSYGRIPDAQAAWLRVASIDPAAAPEAHRALAILAESLGEFDAAEREYAESLRLDPNDAATYRFLGTLLFTRRRMEDRLARAVAALERAVALDPGEPAGFVALGHAYEAAGRAEEALLTLRHAIDIAPGSGAVYLDVGRLARRLGRAEESREMLTLHRRYRQAQRDLEGLRATIAARPNDPAVRLTLAKYYLAARDNARAAGEFERALALGAQTLSPDTRSAARRKLALAYERLARREDASAQRALVKAP